MLIRRKFIIAGGAALAASVYRSALGAKESPAGKSTEKLEFSDAEWRRRLTGPQYKVLREGGTEPAYTSPLNKEHRIGTFSCAGCDLPLFSSTTKFESHTGWPSFWAPMTGAVLTQVDSSFGMVRTEVRCRRCEGHLGHVFGDGPKPTGLRYCINGVALVFSPDQSHRLIG